MKNFSEIGLVSVKCMAVEDEACESVDGFSKPNADIMKEIKAEEDARVREEQKNAAKNQLQLDSYVQEKEAIELRYKRDEEAASSEKLKARTKENNAYMEGGIDTEEHKKNLEKIEDAYTKAMDIASNKRRKALENLRTKNPRGYDRSRWGY